jgi:hypothetical protein
MHREVLEPLSAPTAHQALMWALTARIDFEDAVAEGDCGPIVASLERAFRQTIKDRDVLVAKCPPQRLDPVLVAILFEKLAPVESVGAAVMVRGERHQPATFECAGGGDMIQKRLVIQPDADLGVDQIAVVLKQNNRARSVDPRERLPDAVNRHIQVVSRRVRSGIGPKAIHQDLFSCCTIATRNKYLKIAFPLPFGQSSTSSSSK